MLLASLCFAALSLLEDARAGPRGLAMAAINSGGPVDPGSLSAHSTPPTPQAHAGIDASAPVAAAAVASASVAGAPTAPDAPTVPGAITASGVPVAAEALTASTPVAGASAAAAAALTPPVTGAPATADVLAANASKAIVKANVSIAATNSSIVALLNSTEIDQSRRILKGRPAIDHPYIVYLQMNGKNAKLPDYKGWVCGGVVVSDTFVLTSAACVEDAVHFYIVSGTNNFVDGLDWKTDECVKANRRRVVWKCIPKEYDFQPTVSTKWMGDDIAIVKVEKPFALGTTEPGCQFAVDKIAYNNFDQKLEGTGTKGVIMGWGSRSKFRPGFAGAVSGGTSGGSDGHLKSGGNAAGLDMPDEEDMARQRPGYHANLGAGRSDRLREGQNSKNLLDTNVQIMDKEQCIKMWPQKFSAIIKKWMICTNDTTDTNPCQDKYAKCADVKFDEDTLRMMVADYGRHSHRRRILPDNYQMEQGPEQLQGNPDALRELARSTAIPDGSGGDGGGSTSSGGGGSSDGGGGGGSTSSGGGSSTDDKNTNTSNTNLGGFCENDHGGPMVVDSSKGKCVVGVISACKIDKKTNKCRGPFLYTSVYANRALITCIIDGQDLDDCQRMLRVGENNLNWNVKWTPGDA